jgi:Kdo2-lipid IVA lauroyltransferase/acyltransferase
MNSFLGRLEVWICKQTARLPFWAIYLLSDIVYVLIYYVIKYRKKVVCGNLTRSFPEKSSDEIKSIMKKFYRHLSDTFMETVKYSRMTAQQVDERMKINGIEIYNDYYDQGRSVIMLAMHYNNWEWTGTMGRFLKAQYSYIYDPMPKNKEFEKFLLASRNRFGGISVPFNDSVRLALSFINSSEPKGMLMVADQTAPEDSQFWTTFLNQETSFFTGSMKIAVKTNCPLVLLHSRKVSRGHYELLSYKLVENPKEMKAEDIMLIYAHRIEEIIRKEPEYWLWSHKRWKHKRPADIPLR